MSICLCSECERIFDPDIEVEAEYDPAVCEDCLNDREQEFQQWWQSLDADTQWIKDNA